MRSGLGAVAAWALLVSAWPAQAQECPAALAEATQLVLAVTPSMNASAATLETYERAGKSAPWTRKSPPEPAVVGKNGLGWGLPFRALARDGEPLKVEGDKRAPAGAFRLGATFGFAPASRPNYIKLETDAHFCVDDARSPHYSRIVSKKEAGPEMSGEEMRAISLYKRGIVVDYPTDRAEKAGSCIFIHIWRGRDQPTVGCVALKEKSVARLQGWLKDGAAAIAILPEAALSRFAGCLPPRVR